MFCKLIWYELDMRVKECSIRTHANEVENRYARCPMERTCKKSHFFLLISAWRAKRGRHGPIKEMPSYQEYGNGEPGTWHIANAMYTGWKISSFILSKAIFYGLRQNLMESRPCKIRHVTLNIFRQHIDLIHRRKLIHQCLIDVPTPSRAAKSFLPGGIHLVQQVVRRMCMLVGSRRNFWGAFTWNNGRLSGGISTSHFSFGLRWHFFEWTRRLPSMRMTTQNHVHFGGFGLVWFFVAARCKPAESDYFIE